MRYCQNCGASHADNAKFCKQCGSLLARPVQQRNPSYEDNRQPDPKEDRAARLYQNKQKRRDRECGNAGLVVVMCLTGALLAVLIIGAAILFAMHIAG